MTEYRAFTMQPIQVTDLDGEPLNMETVLGDLTSDLWNITSLANWQLQSAGEFLDEITDYDNTQWGYKAARDMKMKLPTDVKKQLKVNSRFEDMVMETVVRTMRSWRTRSDIANGTHQGYTSSGNRRTASSNAPVLKKPVMNLSATDNRYSSAYDHGDTVILEMLVNTQWVRFHFSTHGQQPDRTSLGKPDIMLDDDGHPKFVFKAGYPTVRPEFSTRYVVAVDLGVSTTASVVVWDMDKETPAHTSRLSIRLNSLANSIKGSVQQVNSLQKAGRKEEARFHREAASRKRGELAILVGQELAALAHFFDNAVIVMEDLGHINNTMFSGRWNRGEVVKWTTNFHEFNGGRVIKVNAAYTSQKCCHCQEKIVHDAKRRLVLCNDCGTAEDRDINAAANIAQKGVDTARKCATTRKKSRKLVPSVSRRTPDTKDSLTYPGCKNNVVKVKKPDRTKNRPTPKRTRRTPVHTPSKSLEEVKENISTAPYHTDDGTVYGDDMLASVPGIRTLEKPVEPSTNKVDHFQPCIE